MRIPTPAAALLALGLALPAAAAAQSSVTLTVPAELEVMSESTTPTEGFTCVYHGPGFSRSRGPHTKGVYCST